MSSILSQEFRDWTEQKKKPSNQSNVQGRSGGSGKREDLGLVLVGAANRWGMVVITCRLDFFRRIPHLPGIYEYNPQKFVVNANVLRWHGHSGIGISLVRGWYGRFGEFVTGMAIRELTTSAQLAMPFTNVREWSGPLGSVREWTRFVGSTEHSKCLWCRHICGCWRLKFVSIRHRNTQATRRPPPPMSQEKKKTMA